MISKLSGKNVYRILLPTDETTALISCNGDHVEFLSYDLNKVDGTGLQVLISSMASGQYQVYFRKNWIDITTPCELDWEHLCEAGIVKGEVEFISETSKFISKVVSMLSERLDRDPEDVLAEQLARMLYKALSMCDEELDILDNLGYDSPIYSIFSNFPERSDW